MRQIRLAFRTLFKTPFVTAIAVASLALGIGANAAIFSLFNQMLLRPLPVRAPSELVNLGAPGEKPGSQSCGQAGDCDAVFSYAMYRDLERTQKVFTGLAGHVVFGANLAYNKATLNTQGMYVSGSYFSVLGLRPALGRLISATDDQTIGGNYVAVLGHRYWVTRLGSDPNVINAPLIVNGQTFTVIGVAPEGFDGTTLGQRPDVYVPITMRGVTEPRFKQFDDRRVYWVYAFGRLKPGVSLEQARSALNAIYHPIINDVEAPLQEGMSDATLARFKAKEVSVEPGARGQSTLHTEAKTPLTMLFAITGVVLLIACANIANLLLARGANRGMEMAVRLSLGAARRQILSQLLIESLVLAALGGLGSLLVARWTLSVIAGMLPDDAVQVLSFHIDPGVLVFAAVLAVVTGFLFGMYPALHSTRPDLVNTLRANSGKTSSSRASARFRTSLVTAQIALSMTLLVCAGLFVRSLVNIGRVDLGLQPENVITFGVSPELNGYAPARSKEFFLRLAEELGGVPGVTAVSMDRVGILVGNNWGNGVEVEGYPSGPDVDNGSRFNQVGPGFVHTVGMTLLAGREFTDADIAGAPKVAIVNEAFAKKFNLGKDAVGKHMSTGDSKVKDIEIVGLVRDAKYSQVKDPTPPVFFRPFLQDTTVGNLNYYIRSSTPPEQMLRTASQLVAKLDPNLPLEDLRTLTQQVRQNVFLYRMISTLSSAFALLATLLAAVGLYGVLAYTVAQRTNEIGVRMALGADSGRVRTMVLRQVGMMVLVGGAVGVAGAIALGKLAASLLYGLTGYDPAVLVSSVVTLTAVALSAGYLPARRASRIAPMQALRYE
ncbi:MAG: ABC transporter permease [Gemmatimonadaceae bacterium]